MILFSNKEVKINSLRYIYGGTAFKSDIKNIYAHIFVNTNNSNSNF